MSVAALASGARASARIPGLFSTSFRHRTIFFTVTAILSPPYCPKNLMAKSYCGLTWAASYATELTRSPDFIRRMQEWRGAFIERGDLYESKSILPDCWDHFYCNYLVFSTLDCVWLTNRFH